MASNEFKEIRSLAKWMKEQKWRNVAKLEPYQFEYTGRGMRTRNGLKSRSLVVQIPKSLLITAGDFRKCLKWKDLPGSKDRLSCCDTLVLCLLFESSKRKDSSFYQYLRTLPSCFIMPTDLDPGLVSLLPDFVGSRILEKVVEMTQSFKKLQGFYNLLTETELQYSHFTWAYYVVNTRAVHLTGSSGKYTAGSDDYMALAPFLDMLNHSPSASCVCGYNPSSESFEIETTIEIGKRSEVFINYGPHDNLLLLIEYGFVVPGNPNSYTPLKFAWFLAACKKMNISVSGQHLKSIESLKLDEKLVCCVDGPSWTVRALLEALTTHQKDLKKIDSTIYRDLGKMTSLQARLLNCVLESAQEQLKESLAKIRKHNKSELIGMFECLLNECLSLLERCYVVGIE